MAQHWIPEDDAVEINWQKALPKNVPILGFQPAMPEGLRQLAREMGVDLYGEVPASKH